MQTKRIVYIGNYDNGDYGHELLTQPSSCSKMNYILNALVEAGYEVDFYSTAIAEDGGFYKNETKYYSHYRINYMISFGRGNFFYKVLSTVLINVQLFLLLLKTPNDTPVLVYHTIGVSRLVNYICSFKKEIKLFVELEEIYAVVRRKKKGEYERELNTINKAMGYIVVNDVIAEICKLKGKTISCYGIYSYSNKIKRFLNKDRINIVYAGGLDSDANNAIDVMNYLPDNYHLYILGYGTQIQIKEINDRIRNINKERADNLVEYLGCMNGPEYSKFLDKCDIGLSTRFVTPEESMYAFPSKIFVYLSHNLLTVSSPHKAMEASSVAGLIYFSKDNKASSIADTILKACYMNKDINYSQEIERLHSDFVCNLKCFFE